MKRAFLACGFSALFLAIAPAEAAIISGTFSGIAENSRVNATGPTPGNFDGSVVTGTFSLDLTAALTPPFFQNSGSLNGTSYTFTIFFNPSVVSLTFNAAGMTASFGTEPGSETELSENSTMQSLALQGGVFPYHVAVLDLVGPPGSFFSNNDLATVHPGPVDLAQSTASFFASRDFGATVLLTDIEAPGFTLLAVPEPASVSLFLGGFGALALLSLLARARSSRSTI